MILYWNNGVAADERSKGVKHGVELYTFFNIIYLAPLDPSHLFRRRLSDIEPVY